MKTFDEYVKERPEYYVGLSSFLVDHDRMVWEAAQESLNKVGADSRHKAIEAIDVRVEAWQGDARQMVYKAELIAELNRIRKYIKELSLKKAGES